VSVAPGVAVLGKPVDFPSFGWDNEYGQRKVDVPAFKASKFLATNAEFLPFVLVSGGLGGGLGGGWVQVWVGDWVEL
jgi:hypothetical protein